MVAQLPESDNRSRRSSLDTLKPYLAIGIGLLTVAVLVVARMVYQAPCLEDCSNRSWQAMAQQFIAVFAVLPAIALITALLRRKMTWIKAAALVLIASYGVWIILIVEVPSVN